VNVASKCELTPRLEKLTKDYGDRGLTVVGAIETVLTR
jgi:glutathione peroxidase-family protein